MQLLHNLSMGFGIAITPMNILVAFIGALMGTLIGVLPGIGPMTGVALLIPLSFSLNPTTAIIMMAGVYCGAMYGGSTTSILLNTPGESASVVTTLDGYQMAQKGRAGTALAIAAIGSFVAGTFSVFMLMLMAPQLAKVALLFGPAEFFALMVMGLSTVTGLGGGSVIKALISLAFGLMLGTVGTDLQTGVTRMTLGLPDLMDGIDFVVVAIGLFAVSEVISSMREPDQKVGTISGSLMPTREDMKQAFWPMVRGTLIGFFTGVLGAGATVASFMSYNAERRVSKHPEKFGTGTIEGVAGPESANNGNTGGAMVPMLTLGVPGSGTTAVLMGALMMFGIRPGPLLFQEHADLVWGLIASMYLGNIMLLVLNLPLVGLFAKILVIPKRVLLPLVLAFTFLGVYSLNQSILDVVLMAVFGLIGYFMKKHGFPAAPAVLALVLGDLMEQSMRQALTISNGSWSIFLTSPISATFLSLAVLSLASPILRHAWTWVRRRTQTSAAD